MTSGHSHGTCLERLRTEQHYVAESDPDVSWSEAFQVLRTVLRTPLIHDNLLFSRTYNAVLSTILSCTATLVPISLQIRATRDPSRLVQPTRDIHTALLQVSLEWTRTKGGHPWGQHPVLQLWVAQTRPRLTGSSIFPAANKRSCAYQSTLSRASTHLLVQLLRGITLDRLQFDLVLNIARSTSSS